MFDSMPNGCGKAQTLRERGVALSDVLREAIDDRFASLGPSDSPLDVGAISTRIFERYPDPPNLPPRRTTCTIGARHVRRF